MWRADASVGKRRRRSRCNSRARFGVRGVRRNRRLAKEAFDRLADRARPQHDDVYARLLAYARAAPEELYKRDTRFRRRLRLDTYGHYPKHAWAIREWRRPRLQPDR